ncbi:GntR family transcriptional regulator [Cellulosimicrobium funkei]|nr:GntR family transcriptional regulator [Cellulosimicrobium funkei]
MTPRSTPTERADSLTRSVLELITDRRVGKDGWLREAEIAAALGISRTPVRDALREMAGAGVVIIEPHKGARIRSYSPGEIEEIYRSRALVEPYVVAAAIPRLGHKDVQTLKEFSQRMRHMSHDAHRRNELATLNREFHSYLLLAAGDHPLASTAINMLIPLLLNRVMHTYDEVQSARSMDQHDELIAAAQLGDPDWAAAIMRSHILGGLNQFKREIAEQNASTP